MADTFFANLWSDIEYTFTRDVKALDFLLHEHVTSACAKTSLSAAGPSPIYQAPHRLYRRVVGWWSCGLLV